MAELNNPSSREITQHDLSETHENDFAHNNNNDDDDEKRVKDLEADTQITTSGPPYPSESWEAASPQDSKDSREAEEEEEEKEQVDTVQSGSPRHSYEYARSTSSRSTRRVPLARHNSAFTAFSAISRRKRTNTVASSFTHPLGKEKTNADVIVTFDDANDLYKPVNWPFKKKVYTTGLYAMATFGVSFASSVYSAGVDQIAAEFNVSTEVSTLGIAFLLFGFGLGPLLWAPLSEVYGRKPAVLAPYFVAGIFSFGTATGKDIQTVLITRFFTGFFGSAPITNTGGVIGDLWTPKQRGHAIVGYALAVIGGPTLGPLVGGAIVTSPLGWRWTEYLTGILILFIVTLDVLIIDETFGAVLLVYKARRLRHDTGNWALHAKHEEWDVSIRDLAEKYLVRPFQMLGTPICFLIALYASFVYGILYANLSAFPIAFQQVRGWNPVVGGLPFIAMLVGIILGAGVNIANQRYYFRQLSANNNRAVPEARLPPMLIGSVIFSAGLWLFAWTAGNVSIHWIAPIIACACIGTGFTTIFQAAINYLIDTFQRYGASAVAANTFMRSMFAGTFPIFIMPMYSALGIAWAGTVFAVVSVVMIPIPYLFFVFGRRIRAKGEWSRESL